MSETIVGRRGETLEAAQRQQIVDAFVAVAVEKGYAGTKVADIIRAAGVSRSAFYDHFADKEAVYVHLYAQVIAALEAAVNQSLERTADEPDWRVRIRDFVTARLEVIAASPTFLGLVAIEGQVGGATAQQIRAEAALRNTGTVIRFSEELANTTSEVARVPEHVVLAGMAAVVGFVSGVAPEGPNAVRELVNPLTDVWIRLFRAA